jgi:hypothetical protein
MNRKIVNFIIFSAIQFEKLRSKVGYHLLCALAIGLGVYFSYRFLPENL